MHRVRRSARVPYTAAQMYALVADIEAYPEFLPWCTGTSIARRSEQEVTATVRVGLVGLGKSFTTRNALEPPGRIGLSLVEGPFKTLEGEWRFTATGDDGCEVSLALDFAVRRSPFSLVFEAAFEEIARSQMQAFIDRAGTVYGAPGVPG